MEPPRLPQTLKCATVALRGSTIAAKTPGTRSILQSSLRDRRRNNPGVLELSHEVIWYTVTKLATRWVSIDRGQRVGNLCRGLTHIPVLGVPASQEGRGEARA